MLFIEVETKRNRGTFTDKNICTMMVGQLKPSSNFTLVEQAIRKHCRGDWKFSKATYINNDDNKVVVTPQVIESMPYKFNVVNIPSALKSRYTKKNYS